MLANTKTQVERLIAVEILMIRWKCSYIRLNKIRNEVFKNKIEVAGIEDKMREVRWVAHIQRKYKSTPVWTFRGTNFIPLYLQL